MFLSRMRLKISSRKTMLALASPNLFHGAVEGAFPMTSAAGAKQSGDESGRSGRKLWRIDCLNEKCYLLLLSETEPDLTNAVKQFGFPDEKSETKDYTPLLKHVTNSSKWRFRLTANPTISKSTRGKASGGDKAQNGTPGKTQRGTLYAHITAEYQKKWLADRAEKHGFKLEADDFDAVSSKWQKFRKGGANGSDVTLLSVTYEGLLTVTDAELFREALIGGIGRGKAYGLGLLTIIPSA